MKKGKNHKRRKPKKIVTVIVALLFLGMSAYFMFKVYQEVMLTVRLQEELEIAEAELDKVEKENEMLTSQKDRLNDDNFVQSYARGNYMLSKEGEKVFFLPGTNPLDQPENEE